MATVVEENYRENKEKTLLLPEASKGFIPARLLKLILKKRKQDGLAKNSN